VLACLLSETMEQHGPNFLELPPDIIEGKPEWEVEKIIKIRLYGYWKKKQYLVRWKDYSPVHDLWVNEEDLHVPELVEIFKNQRSTSIKTMSPTNPEQEICLHHLPFQQLSPYPSQRGLSSVTVALEMMGSLESVPSLPPIHPTTSLSSKLPTSLLMMGVEISSQDTKLLNYQHSLTPQKKSLLEVHHLMPAIQYLSPWKGALGRPPDI